MEKTNESSKLSETTERSLPVNFSDPLESEKFVNNFIEEAYKATDFDLLVYGGKPNPTEKNGLLCVFWHLVVKERALTVLKGIIDGIGEGRQEVFAEAIRTRFPEATSVFVKESAKKLNDSLDKQFVHIKAIIRSKQGSIRKTWLLSDEERADAELEGKTSGKQNAKQGLLSCFIRFRFPETTSEFATRKSTTLLNSDPKEAMSALISSRSLEEFTKRANALTPVGC